MNLIQKIALIVLITTFTFWLFEPKSNSRFEIEIFDDLIVDGDLHYWFKTWYQTLSFSISMGSLLTFFLFRDVKKEDE
tara:strand:+ start:870 stop:1103 length:234 start_codon:yes stop_codon:yes gene_type:complete